MKVVIQKVKSASVEVAGEVVGSIKEGLMLLVGIEVDDDEHDVKKAAYKISNLRIFEDENGKMNRSILDENGSILSVSQFTLAADSRKGNRPSFTEAMRPEPANDLFELFNESLREQSINVATGKFQTHMNVTLNNDGPITIILTIKDGKVV